MIHWFVIFSRPFEAMAEKPAEPNETISVARPATRGRWRSASEDEWTPCTDKARAEMGRFFMRSQGNRRGGALFWAERC